MQPLGSIHAVHINTSDDTNVDSTYTIETAWIFKTGFMINFDELKVDIINNVKGKI